jgi:hypothetical protein
MLWKVIEALEERAEYSQLGRNRWRATYCGFVTLSAEGTDPRDAQYNLAEAFDALLAGFIRAANRRMETEPNVVVQDERRQIEGRKRATAVKPGT